MRMRGVAVRQDEEATRSRCDEAVALKHRLQVLPDEAAAAGVDEETDLS